MSIRAAGPFALVLTLAFAAPAQTPDEPESRLDRQVEEMRRQVTQGRTFRSHVRVTVRLNNGNRMRGVVKDGFVVERIDGMRFVAAEANEEGAGMRLYYWDGRSNFVFLPFDDIKEYRINERLSSQQLAALERKAHEEEQQLREEERGANPVAGEMPVGPLQGPQPSTPLGEPQAPPIPQNVPAGPAPAKKDDLSTELQDLFQLVQQYPPADGWNAAKRDEIQRRRTVVGANPSEKEWKFVERFADWQRACVLFGQSGQSGDQNGDQGGGQNGDDQGDGRRRRR